MTFLFFMGVKMYLSLNDINAYKISFNLSNYVWRIVVKWDFFAKDIVGKQIVRSVDSISSNIAEGFGRYGKRDKTKFYKYSKASTFESLDWLQKAKVRNLVSEGEYNYIFAILKSLPKEINHLISFTNEKLSH